jgi:hypothetical protein
MEIAATEPTNQGFHIPCQPSSIHAVLIIRKTRNEAINPALCSQCFVVS